MVLVRLATGARELDIVANINQTIICALCRQLSLDPHIMSCGNVLCPDCLTLLSSRTTECPCGTICGHPFSFLRFEMQVLNLMVKCPNFSNGCNSLIPMKCVDEHLKQCRSSPLTIPPGYDVEVYNIVDNLADTVSVAIDLGYPLKFEMNERWIPEELSQELHPIKRSEMLTTNVGSVCTEIKSSNVDVTPTEESSQRTKEGACKASSVTTFQNFPTPSVIEDNKSKTSNTSESHIGKYHIRPTHAEPSQKLRTHHKKMNENDILYMDEGVLKLLESGVPGRTRGIQKHFKRSRNSFQSVANYRTSKASTYRKLTAADTQLLRKYSLIYNLKQVKVVVEKLLDEDFQNYISSGSARILEPKHSLTDSKKDIQAKNDVDNIVECDGNFPMVEEKKLPDWEGSTSAGSPHELRKDRPNIAIKITEAYVGTAKQLRTNFKPTCVAEKIEFRRKLNGSQPTDRAMNDKTSEIPVREAHLNQQILQRKQSSVFEKKTCDSKPITNNKKQAFKGLAACSKDISTVSPQRFVCETTDAKPRLKRALNQQSPDLKPPGNEQLVDRRGSEQLGIVEEDDTEKRVGTSSNCLEGNDCGRGLSRGRKNVQESSSLDQSRTAIERNRSFSRRTSNVSCEHNALGHDGSATSTQFNKLRKTSSTHAVQSGEPQQTSYDPTDMRIQSQNEKRIPTGPSCSGDIRHEIPLKRSDQNEGIEERDIFLKKRYSTAEGLFEQFSKVQTKRFRFDMLCSVNSGDVTASEALQKLLPDSNRATSPHVADVEESNFLTVNADRNSHELSHEHELDLPVLIPLEPLVAVKDSTLQQHERRPIIRPILELKTFLWDLEEESTDQVSVSQEDEEIGDRSSSSSSSDGTTTTLTKKRQLERKESAGSCESSSQPHSIVSTHDGRLTECVPPKKQDSRQTDVLRQSIFTQKPTALTLCGNNSFQRGQINPSWLGDAVMETSSFWSSRS